MALANLAAAHRTTVCPGAAVQLQAGDASRRLRAFRYRNMTQHSEEAVAVLRSSA